MATLSIDGKVDTVVLIPSAPGGLGFLSDGSVLIVSMEDRQLLRFQHGCLEVLADLSHVHSWHSNDLVVDSFGRAYVGTFGFDFLGGAPPAPATIALVSTEGEVSVAAEAISFANGMVITPDGQNLIVAETLGDRLTSFDIAADGSLYNRRVFCQIPRLTPDGICLDADGGVWVSSIFNEEFIRVVRGGRVTHRISVPGRWAVACTLGGVNGTTLFLCTAETSMQDMRKGQSRGFIEVVEVDTPGAQHEAGTQTESNNVT